jgi:hypothetical protein
MSSTPYFCPILIKLEFSRHTSIFKNTNIKFHEDPTSGSRVPCGRTDITNLIVTFRNFAKAPNVYDWEKISITSNAVRGTANCNKEQSLCLPSKSRDCNRQWCKGLHVHCNHTTDCNTNWMHIHAPKIAILFQYCLLLNTIIPDGCCNRNLLLL